MRRLRELAARPLRDAPADHAPPANDDSETSEPPSSPSPSSSADVVVALRDLERRLAAVEGLLRRLPVHERFDQLADEVAEAVVDRLDARWLGRLDDDNDDATV